MNYSNLHFKKMQGIKLTRKEIAEKRGDIFLLDQYKELSGKKVQLAQSIYYLKKHLNEYNMKNDNHQYDKEIERYNELINRYSLEFEECSLILNDIREHGNYGYINCGEFIKKRTK